jgi:nicotinate-nucleotide adenylyltransferase
MRLGILGGTFDPIHLGHLLLARFSAEALGLDQVLFVPAAVPPHKEAASIWATPADRWHMTELALEGTADFSASCLELERSGPSYTVDTLRQLHHLRPDCTLYWIIGSDNVAPMHTWYRPHEILALCTVVAGARTTREQHQGDPTLAARIVQLETPLIELSSTQIRRRVQEGRPIRYMVPPSVEAYIQEKGLYRA